MDAARKRVKADIRGRAMAWLFLLCALPACLLALTLRPGFYSSYWAASETPERFWQVTNEDADRLWEAIPRALNGDADALRLQVRDPDGQARPAFREREIAHMADVAHLYRLAKIVLCAGGAPLLALTIWAWHGCWHGKKSAGIAKGALLGALDVAVLAAGVFVWAAVDFRSVFWLFHQLAFTNDLWLLDPSDLLIRLMPQSFFAMSALKIALCWAGCAALWLCGARAWLHRAKSEKGEGRRDGLEHVH